MRLLLLLLTLLAGCAPVRALDGVEIDPEEGIAHDLDGVLASAVEAGPAGEYVDLASLNVSVASAAVQSDVSDEWGIYLPPPKDCKPVLAKVIHAEATILRSEQANAEARPVDRPLEVQRNSGLGLPDVQHLRSREESASNRGGVQRGDPDYSNQQESLSQITDAIEALNNNPAPDKDYHAKLKKLKSQRNALKHGLRGIL